VWILSPAGKALGRIVPPEHDANFTFGDADGKSLYLTASTGLYRVRVNVPGIGPDAVQHAAAR
jgi:gluconolactonase